MKTYTVLSWSRSKKGSRLRLRINDYKDMADRDDRFYEFETSFRLLEGAEKIRVSPRVGIITIRGDFEPAEIGDIMQYDFGYEHTIVRRGFLDEKKIKALLWALEFGSLFFLKGFLAALAFDLVINAPKIIESEDKVKAVLKILGRNALTVGLSKIAGRIVGKLIPK